ncbi:tRNA dimethylallyltransferase [bioreactor metagenome]|uniref:tRNA dimethylallyltransferase n=1 Tax=bioreactor metagenome TaxID=1076179 RepID=A0A645BD90_9ZZZZ
MYVNSLTYPLGFAIPRDDEIRERISGEYDKDPGRVYARLKSVDPRTADRLHVNDKKRVIRALEVFECAGKPLSEYGGDFQNSAGEQPPYEPLLFGLNMDRERLYGRINLRVDLMMKAGLLEEARRIYDARYEKSLPAMRSIGYQQLFAYFDGTCSLEEAVEQIKLDTRHFAKRQLTWFKRDERIRWHDVTNWDNEKSSLLNELTKQAKDWMNA